MVLQAEWKDLVLTVINQDVLSPLPLQIVSSFLRCEFSSIAIPLTSFKISFTISS